MKLDLFFNRFSMYMVQNLSPSFTVKILDVQKMITQTKPITIANKNNRLYKKWKYILLVDIFYNIFNFVSYCTSKMLFPYKSVDMLWHQVWSQYVLDMSLTDIKDFQLNLCITLLPDDFLIDKSMNFYIFYHSSIQLDLCLRPCNSRIYELFLDQIGTFN